MNYLGTRSLTVAQTIRRLAYKPTDLLVLVEDHEFPRPISLDTSRIGWETEQVEDWIRRRGIDRLLS